MLSGRESRSVVDLATAMLSTRPLAVALGTPVRVVIGSSAADSLAVANVIGAGLGYPALVAGDRVADPFHVAIGRRLALADRADELGGIPRSAWPEVEAQALRAARDDFSSFCEQALVTSGDGTPVLAYAAGDPTAPAVLLSAPCGMPARLVEPWMRHLARRARVVTWESRGMFGDVDDDRATDVAAQVDDALAVLTALNLDGAHVAGLCGGAVVATELAAAAASRVSSISLWHGDFHLGELAGKTDHQRDLLDLMDMAARSLPEAASIHRIVCQSVAASIPADLAAQLLYPYATPQLFLRYCRLNSAIMKHDITATLADVTMPALVVTSRTDRTAHPDGSVAVAHRLPDAKLVVRAHGDHLTLFDGAPELLSLLDVFRDSVDRPIQTARPG